MSRPAWKGFLRLSLVSVPVQAYTTMVTGQGEIHLNQLHDKCHNRIRYKKICPVHGEVSNDEIVMGYEYAKGQYVEIEDEEREAAHSRSNKSIDIDKFVPLAAIDPVYLQGRNYYLVPDGPGGEKPYALFYAAMRDEKRCAVAQVAFAGRDEVVVIKAADSVLTMLLLNFESQLRTPREFEEDLPHAKPAVAELKLAKTLIANAFADELDLSAYKDTYTDKLKEIIDAKVEGHEVISAAEDEAPPVISLMDALRKSVAQKGARGKPSRKMVKSARQLTPAKKRRKSS